MKAYGLPRNLDAAYPDCADVRRYARKSKFGDIRNRAAKAATRRLFKRSARRASAAACMDKD
jgi:hypothetical protein